MIEIDIDVLDAGRYVNITDGRAMVKEINIHLYAYGDKGSHHDGTCWVFLSAKGSPDKGTWVLQPKTAIRLGQLMESAAKAAQQPA